MERLTNTSLDNAIDVYKFAMETCLKNNVEDYVPTLDKATISLLKELKEYRSTNITPQQIIELDNLYREKCEEVARLEIRIKQLEEQLRAKESDT